MFLFYFILLQYSLSQLGLCLLMVSVSILERKIVYYIIYKYLVFFELNIFKGQDKKSN